jgi:hypothetical protein
MDAGSPIRTPVGVEAETFVPITKQLTDDAFEAKVKEIFGLQAAARFPFFVKTGRVAQMCLAGFGMHAIRSSKHWRTMMERRPLPRRVMVMHFAPSILTYINAYVPYLHFVERLYKDATTPIPHGTGEGARAESGHPAPATEHKH